MIINRPVPFVPGQVKANSTAAQVFPNSLTPTQPVILTIPGGGRLEQRKFIIRASGYVTTVGAYTVVVSLGYKVAVPATPLTLANWTLLGASTARSVSTASAPWWIEAQLEFDSVSGALQGTFETMINNLYDARAAVTNALASVSGDSGSAEPVANVVAAVTFNTGNVGNIGNLGAFDLAAD